MLREEVKDLWDTFHPSESGDLEEEFCEAGDYSDLEDVARIPTIDLLPELVDYSTRGPGDFIISGPLGAGRGTGRHFNTVLAAQNWAVLKYGRNRVKRIEGEGSEYRWGFLIKAA